MFRSATNIKTYKELLIELNNNKIHGTSTPPKIHQTTYGVFKNDKLIGGFNLRKELVGNTINHGGHIGYLIRPSKKK